MSMTTAMEDGVLTWFGRLHGTEPHETLGDKLTTGQALF
jgi:hypothetical protein